MSSSTLPFEYKAGGRHSLSTLLYYHQFGNMYSTCMYASMYDVHSSIVVVTCHVHVMYMYVLYMYVCTYIHTCT